MTRRTYLEQRWPDSPLFQEIAERWCADQSRMLLDLVWRGYDALFASDLSKIPLSANNEAKEESLNFLLSLRIDQCKTGDEPFAVSHQPPEQTKRKRGKGRSPQPDIGFVLYGHPRSIWPMEGKILNHDRDVGLYVREVNENLLTARYATFSQEGAMLGYLLKGETETTFHEVHMNLGITLSKHPFFGQRSHRVSQHMRSAKAALVTPDFTCHHLILSIPVSQPD
jgi:hypothetical protein